jgi:hypothetical protein
MGWFWVLDQFQQDFDQEQLPASASEIATRNEAPNHCWAMVSQPFPASFQAVGWNDLQYGKIAKSSWMKPL